MSRTDVKPSSRTTDDAGAVDLDRWRGVAAEDTDDLPDPVSMLLRGRTRGLLRTLLRPYKRTMWLLLLLVLGEDAAAMAGPYLVKVGIDDGIPRVGDGKLDVLFICVALLLVAAVAQAVLRREFLLRGGKVGQDVLLELRRRVFDHFQRLSVSFHDRYTSGRVISRLTSDMDSISELLETGLDELVLAVLSVVTVTIIMLLLDWRLALVSLSLFPVLVALSVWFSHGSAAAYRRGRETVALVIVHFTESLRGIRAVQAFGRERRNDEIFAEVNDRYRAANERSFKLIAIFAPATKLIGNITIALVLAYGGYLALHHEMTVGVLAAFLLYLRQFFDPMQDIAMFYNSYQAAAAALEKLAGVLDEPLSVPEPEEPQRLGARHGAFQFEHVRFGYGNAVVLPDLDLTVPAGQTIALIGATGAGKTTVARLLARFYDPDAGRVLLDGVDLRALSERDLRRAVVMVTQEGYIFSGTIAENISFGRPGSTRAEIEHAARAIGAHSFISELPDGYDSDVGKRGSRLSAGQRQLIAFARAFLAAPSVLILDEATSSLDVPSERLVQRAMRTVLAERTALIIAHRLSTVEIADRALVLDAGRIVEDGRPADLLRQGGRYAGLRAAWLESLV